MNPKSMIFHRFLGDPQALRDHVFECLDACVSWTGVLCTLHVGGFESICLKHFSAISSLFPEL
jgi:hypothetical protein